jgi:hypothetical protein
VSGRSEIAIEGKIRAGESFSRKFGHDPGRAVYDCGPDKKDNETKEPADLEHEMAEVGASVTEHLQHHHSRIGTHKEPFSSEKDFSTLFFYDSAVIPFAVKMWKQGEHSAFLCASVAAKSLINKMSAFSQACSPKWQLKGNK